MCVCIYIYNETYRINSLKIGTKYYERNTKCCNKSHTAFEDLAIRERKQGIFKNLITYE